MSTFMTPKMPEAALDLPTKGDAHDPHKQQSPLLPSGLIGPVQILIREK